MPIVKGTRKLVTLLTLHAFLFELIFPFGRALALTSGPNQPEFSSFEPVATTNMVDPLTGQLTYNLPVVNIPGPDGSGYALSLSYHAGASPEEEASWVGYGWTLNPGAISRMKRGFPDDYNGETVRYLNRTPANWTVTAGYTTSPEIFSQVPLTVNTAIRYNNYRGFGYVAGVSANVKGLATLGFSVSDQGGHFDNSIHPAELLGYLGSLAREPKDAGFVASTMHAFGKTYLNTLHASAEAISQYSVANEIRSTNFSPYSGTSVNVSYEMVEAPATPPIGPNAAIYGNYTKQEPANNGVSSTKAYGYMYSANAGDNDMMDYYVEKDLPYTKRDLFLSVPFSNADYYSVSGQGIAGGFRLYNKKPGQYHPNHVESNIGIFNLTLKAHLSEGNLGYGLKYGVGQHNLTIGPWSDHSIVYKFAGDADGDEPYFFRMNNDLGGSVTYSNNDDPVAASMAGSSSWGLSQYDPAVNTEGIGQMNEGKRSGRSTYVGYSTFKEIVHSPSLDGEIFPNFQAHDQHPIGGLSYSDQPDRVAEFAMTSEDGRKYTYGLPVFSRKEKNMQYGLNQLNVLSLQNRYLAYANATPETSPIAVGEERDGAYASTYLLTTVTTPDYVDRTMDGLTPDDFGGYTHFDYIRTAGEDIDYSKFNVDPSTIPLSGSSVPRRFSKTVKEPSKWADPHHADDNTWYKWRVPYRGLQYQPNTLSDDKDDMGSMAMGERELYYLGVIDTKTHVAVFVTNGGIYTHGKWFPGSGQQRKDGYEAVHNEYDVTGNATATRAQIGSTQSPNQLRRLERIELWSKANDGSLKELIQTTHFEYDSSLCRGLPNSFLPSGITPPYSSGKLTLKRVYTEYNGVVNARISPYVFGYQYRKGADYDGLPSEDRTKYQKIINFANSLDADEQNPVYSPFMLDRWGCYQNNGVQRHDNMNTWVDQKPDANPDPVQFDPAAWQLKWIRLPSGGEIHIQYEQNDYSYVQDRVAMSMVPLTGGNLTLGTYDVDETSLGISPGSPEQKGLIQAIRDLYVNGDERIYFKFLHSLDGNPADIANIEDHKLEYVKGYAKITDVDKNPSNGHIRITIPPGPNTPTALAQEYARNIRPGLVGKKGLRDEGDARSRVRSLMSMVGTTFNSFASDVDQVDWMNSYVRIPLGKPGQIVKSKLGGGIRVKRLLMYDQGLEAAGGHLFGTEYSYKTVEGYSSGVATNEPSEGREENALVRPLDRRVDQPWLERILAGKDLDQFEGPIGESLLPAPSIMYSRVVAQSIHQGLTSSGFTINEYYTARDFPSQCIYGPSQGEGVNTTSIDRHSEMINVPAVYFFYNRSNIWATQGYRFIMNQLAGRPKKISTYGGDPAASPSTWVESSSQEFVYFSPGEKMPMMYGYSTNPTWKMEDPGKEMEVALEGRAIEDVTVDASAVADATIGIAPPIVIPFASFSGSVAYNESKLRTHVTCKVVRYPAILKKTISRQDGIESSVENIGFNPLNGEPVATRTTDGHAGLTLQFGGGSSGGVHDRSYKSFSYPAAQEYTEMGQKAQNERATIQTDPANLIIDKRYDGGKHYLSFRYKGANQVCSASDFLSTGDLVDIYTPTDGAYDPDKSIGVFHVDKISGNRVMLLPHSGTIPALLMSGVSIRIIRSGRTNQLGIPRAGVTVYSHD